MKIIALEGLDKSGKASASRHIANILTEKGFRVAEMDFHRYHTPTGSLIRQWLKREIEMNKNAIELIMLADKVAALDDFSRLEKQGIDFLVLDRYKLSQAVYWLSSIDRRPESFGINNAMHKILKAADGILPDPDMTIILDIPAEVSMSRKGKHGENDRYESDRNLLREVRHNYLQQSVSSLFHVVNAERPVDIVNADLEPLIEKLL